MKHRCLVVTAVLVAATFGFSIAAHAQAMPFPLTGDPFAGVDNPTKGSCVSTMCAVASLLDLQTIGREVPRGNDTWSFLSGAGILTLGFLIGLGLEYRKALSGSKPDWVGLVGKTALFVVLLASFHALANTLMRTMLSLGNLDALKVAEGGHDVYATRLKAFVEAERQRNESGWTLSSIGTSSLLSAQEFALSTVVAISYSFAAAVVLMLKIIQQVMFAVLRVVGPIMIGVSSLPGPTSKLFVSWLMLVIEVGSWGLVGNVFLRFMNDSWSHRSLSTQASTAVFEDLAFNVVYAFSFLLIPVIGSMIVRGGGVAGVAGQIVGFAAGLAGGAAGAVAGGAGAISKHAAGGALNPSTLMQSLAPTGSLSGTGSAPGAEPAGEGGGGARSPKVAAIVTHRSIEKQRREQNGE